MQILTSEPCVMYCELDTYMYSNKLLKATPNEKICFLSLTSTLKVNSVIDCDICYEIAEMATGSIWYVKKENVSFLHLRPYIKLDNLEFNPKFLIDFQKYCDPKQDYQVLIHQATAVIKSFLKDKYIAVELNTNQFTALVSFVADNNPSILRKSLLLKYLNEKQYDKAANEFGRWNKENKIVLDRKVKLRKAERELFLTNYD